jgi:hypothetical protein
LTDPAQVVARRLLDASPACTDRIRPATPGRDPPSGVLVRRAIVDGKVSEELKLGQKEKQGEEG